MHVVSYDEFHCAYLLQSKNKKTEFIDVEKVDIFECYEKKKSVQSGCEFLLKKRKYPLN